MTESKQEKSLARRVKFNYVKSNLFRVIHADGAVVALNPNQDISINLFSQRFSIPDESIVELGEDGMAISETTISDIEEENVDSVVIREIDVLAVMSLDGARQLVDLLQDIIEGYEEEEEEEEEYKNTK